MNQFRLVLYQHQLFSKGDLYFGSYKNRFEALYELEKKHSVNDMYTTMINAHMDAAEKCIPERKRVKHQCLHYGRILSAFNSLAKSSALNDQLL